MLTRVPQRITDKHVLELCARVVPGGAPTFVRVHPDPGAIPAECFATVKHHTERSGGSVVLGWRIWELPGVLVYAEFHAVWRDDEGGQLLDVSARITKHSHVLFLKDLARSYDGKQVDSVRLAIRNDDRIRRLIELEEVLFEVTNRGQRAMERRSSISAPELVPILKELNVLKRELLVSHAADRNAPCPCGSSLKFKRCCGN